MKSVPFFCSNDRCRFELVFLLVQLYDKPRREKCQVYYVITRQNLETMKFTDQSDDCAGADLQQQQEESINMYSCMGAQTRIGGSGWEDVMAWDTSSSGCIVCQDVLYTEPLLPSITDEPSALISLSHSVLEGHESRCLVSIHERVSSTRSRYVWLPVCS